MNIWRKFLDLIPNQPTLVGTIAAVEGGGRYQVSISGGTGTIIAYSEAVYAVSDKVFVKGDRIEREAPALTPVTIDV